MTNEDIKSDLTAHAQKMSHEAVMRVLALLDEDDAHTGLAILIHCGTSMMTSALGTLLKHFELKGGASVSSKEALVDEFLGVARGEILRALASLPEPRKARK